MKLCDIVNIHHATIYRCHDKSPRIMKSCVSKLTESNIIISVNIDGVLVIIFLILIIYFHFAAGIRASISINI